MTLGYWKDYQELFNGISIYYDLSSRGISGTVVQNLATPGTNDGTLVGTGWTFTDEDRFGITKQTNANWSTSKYISSPLVINHQNTTLAAWVKLSTTGNGTARNIFGFYTVGSGNFITSVNASRKLYLEMSFPSAGTEVSKTATNTFPNNEWTFVVATWGTVYLVNLYYFSTTGLIELMSSTNNVYPLGNTKTFSVGAGNWNTGYINPFSYGNIGETMVFLNKQLSKAEIYQLWDLTRKKYLYPILPGVRSVE